MKVVKLSSNFFQFIFESQKEKDRILQKRPSSLTTNYWSYNNGIRSCRGMILAQEGATLDTGQRLTKSLELQESQLETGYTLYPMP